jgi:hypothetical protein
MSVTHDMIAAKLDVNRTTVTKALKGDTSIRESTRKRVIETASLMGYDFKQSQQNRREGKRFFVKEEIIFTFLDYANDRPIMDGEGTLANVSATGLLIRLNFNSSSKVPIGEIGVRLKVTDSSPLSVVPRARIVRINYVPNMELAAKFEKADFLPQKTLLDIEKRSFAKIAEA